MNWYEINILRDSIEGMVGILEKEVKNLGFLIEKERIGYSCREKNRYQVRMKPIAWVGCIK